jgi:hypothetical protein
MEKGHELCYMDYKEPVISCSLTAVAIGLVRYTLDIVGVQEVRWEKGSTVKAWDCIFSREKETKIINWEQDFFVHHRTVSAVTTVDFVSDSMLYMVLSGCISNIIV